MNYRHLIMLVGLCFTAVYVFAFSLPQQPKLRSETPRSSASLINFSVFTPKNYSHSLMDVFGDDSLVVYFFHQRKAGGSSIRKFLWDTYKATTAKAPAYIPCITLGCHSWDPDPRRQFINTTRLLAGHLGYTTAAARAVYGEQQVLMTNFRQPVSRIISCFYYRFPGFTNTVLSQDPFVIEAAAKLLMEKPDHDGDSCAGEPFRMLSPYNPDEPRTEQEVATVCDFVKNYVHVLNLGANMTNAASGGYPFFTRIEKELNAATTSYRTNVNKRSDGEGNTTLAENLQVLKEFLPTMPVVQSELQLYDCISRRNDGDESSGKRG